jgi:HEAT repeat protein
LPRLRELLSLPRTRTAAAEAIWQIAGDPEPLFAVVRETVAAGSPEGIDTLGGVGAAAAPLVGDVAAALDHEFRWTRATAATALGKIGGPEASEALTRRLDVERDPKAVEAIRKALAEIRE